MITYQFHTKFEFWRGEEEECIQNLRIRRFLLHQQFLFGYFSTLFIFVLQIIRIFEYLALFKYYSNIFHNTNNILFDQVNFAKANNIRYLIQSKINIRLNTDLNLFSFDGLPQWHHVSRCPQNIFKFSFLCPVLLSAKMKIKFKQKQN